MMKTSPFALYTTSMPDWPCTEHLRAARNGPFSQILSHIVLGGVSFDLPGVLDCDILAATDGEPCDVRYIAHWARKGDFPLISTTAALGLYVCSL